MKVAFGANELFGLVFSLRMFIIVILLRIIFCCCLDFSLNMFFAFFCKKKNGAKDVEMFLLFSKLLF